MHIPPLQSLPPLPAQPASTPSLAGENLAAMRIALTTLEEAVSPGSILPAPELENLPGISTFGMEMFNLSSALSAGNLESAAAAHRSLKRIAESLDVNISPQMNGIAGTPLFASLLAEVETSLKSGNASDAQSALDTFMQGLASGMVINTSGWMPTVPGKPVNRKLRKFSSMKSFNSSWFTRMLGAK